MMIGEVIAIGDELTSGERLDTNSQWISRQLADLGVRVLYHSTVADDQEALVRVFCNAIGRADIVVATGGLGPTADDLTREAIAAATGTDLVRNEKALETIRALFSRRGRKMPEQNERQAMFPRGSVPIPNPHGTAPGIDMAVARLDGGACHLFALPGVPDELFEMWDETVRGAIAARRPTGRVIRHRQLKCFGAGESHIEAMLPDLIRRGRVPSVGITASRATITLRLTAEGATQEECYASMEPTLATIHECLGSLVYGEEDEEIQHVVARLLAQRDQTLATAEWGSGGLIARWLTDVDELCGRYLGGLVISSEQALAATLDVPIELVRREGASGRAVAEAMATAVRNRLGTDYGLAVSDVPRDDSRSSAPAHFSIALATAGGVTAKSFPYAAHPSLLKTLCAKHALNVLRLALS